MIDISFLSDDAFLKIKTIRRLKKLLQREKRGYLRVLHQRCGVGLTVAEFDAIVNSLVASDWCSLKQGTQGSVMVVFNDAFNSVNVPDVEAAS